MLKGICTYSFAANAVELLQRATMSMEGLPNELVMMIADHLQTKDILRCRHVWNKFTAVLQNRSKRLYVHPTRLRDVIAVCDRPDFSESITELVIVGRIPEYAWTFTRLFAYDREYVVGHPWPETPLTDPLTIPKHRYQFKRIEKEPFSQQYRDVVKALQNLKYLEAVRFSDSASLPGICPVTTSTVERYPGSIKCFKDSHDKGGLEVSLRTRWTDAEVFFGILLSLPNMFTSLAIDHHFAMGRFVSWKLLMDANQMHHYSYPDSERTFGFGKQVTHCCVVIPGTTEYHDFVQRLTCSMPALQSLTLLYVPLNDHATKEHDWISTKNCKSCLDSFSRLDYMLSNIHCSDNLKHLELQASTSDGKPLRMWGLKPLLERHMDSLKSLKISNAYLWKADLTDPSRTLGTKRLLRFLKTQLKLVKVELRINCSCDGMSYSYGWRDSDESGMLKALAQELKVQVEEDGYDDFAKCEIQNIVGDIGTDFSVFCTVDEV